MTETARPAAPEAAEAIASGSPLARPPQSPWALFWRQFLKSQLAVAGGALLAVFYLLALFAPFVAPYPFDEMDRQRFFHPPQRLHWVEPGGRQHLLPFIHPTRLAGSGEFRYEEVREQVVPVRLFVRGSSYKLFGILPGDRHLFGVEEGQRISLLGTDNFGRDEFSRLLFGAQISLSVGLLGMAISFSIGLLLGGVAGYFGGAVDSVLMRTSELLFSIPGLYLIIALRGIFPLDLPSQQVYLAIILILSFIGWAGLARIVRGMVLSIRRHEYVLAAEALGAGRLRIIARHILPNTMSFVIVAATLSIPAYILGEVFLSFLGAGVQEPSPSWGNMLQQARTLRTLTSFPWLLFAPGIAIFMTVLAFNFLGDGLRDALDPRKVLGAREG